MTHTNRQAQTTASCVIPLFVAGTLAALSAVAVSFAVKVLNLPPATRIGLALVPTPLYAWLVLLIVRAVRRMDEMQRRIHAEAAAMCLAITAVTTTCYGHLQWTGAPDLNWSYMWVLITLVYSVAYMLAQRHYR